LNLTPKQEKYYVYHLIDPRDGSVFYVGKGTGDRVFHHERDAKNARFFNIEKEQRILDILLDGFDVERKIVKRFEVESESYDYERQEIDRIGRKNLTNITSGRTSDTDRAIAKGVEFIKRMNLKISALSGSSKEIAISLRDEMSDNVNLIRAWKDRGAKSVQEVSTNG